ncbi:MAG: T9SS type A sorting domain-containing protein [Bacteroidota bacterium]|jgi:hypothetical protein|nr:T9SS type A sorting domain-containing protein [Bacteroidota bacterium]
MGRPTNSPTWHAARWSTALVLCVLLTAPIITTAQPNLNFQRVTVNWPTIELYFSVGCNGSPAYNISKQDIRIYENDALVPDFTLWCPDPTIPCAISVSLVFDASGSMSGSNNTGAKQGGHAFVDLMDGVIDEAAIVFFSGGSQVWVEQQMTFVKPMLHQAVDNLPVLGMTAVWDGIHAGLIELINNGVNQCRAVIAMTDGGDNASVRTPSEIMSLANRHRIRVFTIGLGTGINATELELIALLTGGRYYQTPNAGNLSIIFAEIMTLIRQFGQECIITYERDCADGAMREVDLLLSNYCGGTDLKTKTYRAPLDSSTFTALPMTLGSADAAGNADVKVPLTLPGSINGDMFYPFSFRLDFDASCMQFVGVTTPPGSLLEGLPLSVTPVSGGVRIDVTGRKALNAAGTLLEFTFHTSSPADSAHCLVQVADARFEQGCFLPVVTPGTVRIRSYPVPSITAGGPTTFCDGGSVTLTASSGFTSYRWSTGQTSQSITARQSGSYTVTTTDGQGRQVQSAPIQVTVLPLPAVAITPSGTVSICNGGSVELDAGAGFSSYQWSNGQQQQKITVAAAGVYAVTVVGGNGCSATSAPVVVVVEDSLRPVITPEGPTTFCAGGSVVLDAGAGFATYRWSDGSTGRRLTASASGSFAVTVTDARGCVGVSPPVRVTVHPSPQPSIWVAGPTTICDGDSVQLTANPESVSYLWSSGETTRSIHAKRTNSYSVTVRNAEGCSGTSSAVNVLVQPRPPKPTISRNGDALLTQGAYRYQWLRDGAAMTGQTGQFLIVTRTGSYEVIAYAENGCSTRSDPFFVSVLSAEVPSSITAFELYPDPNDGALTVRLNTERPVTIILEVTDMLGQVLQRHEETRPTTQYLRQLDLGAISAGIYFLRVTAGTELWTRRFIRR